MEIKTTVFIYAGWIFVHYASAHAYTYFCVPLTWKGLLLSPFTVPTFHCTGLRWLTYVGGNKMISMWVLASIYMLDKLNNRKEYEGCIG